MSRYLGVDVGGTNVRGAVWEGREALPLLVGSERIPGDYEAFIELLASFGWKGGGRIDGVGVGVPARVSGGTVEWAPNIPFLDGRELATDLCRAFGAPARLAIDGQLALLGEARFGAARGAGDAILVSVGTGIGGAIMLGRRIVRGRHGTAGAFGWLPLGDKGALGRHASWEEIASGSALQAAGQQLDPPLSAAELLSASRVGVSGAGAILDQLALDIGRGLAGLASIFDPELVLVSGGVSGLVGELHDQVEEAFRGHLSPSLRGTRWTLAEHPELAGAYGAAVFAAEAQAVFLP